MGNFGREAVGSSDGVVQIQNGSAAGLRAGDFVDVAILGSDEHDLYGETAAPIG